MDEFEAHRPHLHAVATRILGSRAEADDALQEAWLRVSRADTGDVDNIGGWQTRETTVVSQPPRLSTSLVSARSIRSHASWRASSASAREPRIRVATACR